MKLWEVLIYLTEIKFEHNKDLDMHHHAHEIDGHKVGVWLDHHGNGKYTANFHVNGNMSKDKKGPEGMTKGKILHHVNHVMHSFVKDHKPKAVHFSAHDDDPHAAKAKDKLYHHFGRELADKHGGTVKKTGGEIRVNFK